MGRPTKLNKETTGKIIEAIRAGSYYEPACRAAGIHYSTFRRWLERGEKAKSGRYHEFREQVTRAEAESEIAIVEMWKDQMPRDWRACRDFLARRFPQRWSLNAQGRNEEGTAPILRIYLPENFRSNEAKDENEVSSSPEQLLDVA